MLRRLLLRGLVATATAAGAVVGGAGPAGAHATILGTEPAYGASLAAPPDRVLIRYDLPVEVRGAKVTLERSGETVRVGRPEFASADRKDVSLPLSGLKPGPYVLTWFLFGSDGDVMGGELAFTVLPAPGPGTTAAGPSLVGPSLVGPSLEQSASVAASTQVGFTPLSRAQEATRLAATASLAVLVGGLTFVAGLWWAGALVSRLRVLLWASLAGGLVANALALGLKGAAVQGRGAWSALSPSVLNALDGTHVGDVLMARLGFLLLAVPVVAVLTTAPERALKADLWYVGAGISALGALVTHGLLSHAYSQGALAWATHVVHLAAVSVWLGGLVTLAVVVLPRRQAEELAELVPRFSRLAFGSVATAMVAGSALLILISPRWAALPTSEYGRLLIVKLLLVAGLLYAASRARGFVREQFLRPPPEHRIEMAAGGGGVGTLVAERTATTLRLQPFTNMVLAEVCIAASILIATALLVGRAPPG